MTPSAASHPIPDLHDAGDNSPEVDVLVVGAGPTGLTAAAEALRHGLSVRIIEKKQTRSDFSKALVVHARTMEAFELMGIDEQIRALGAPFAALNLYFNNRQRKVRVNLLNQPWGDTKYPYWLSLPQYDTERVLEQHLRSLGGEVEWTRPLHTLTPHADFVEATLQGEHGMETIRARWVIGCDGGRSTVRDQARINLKRTGAGTTFLLADVKTTSTLVEDEGHLYLAPEGLLILVPMPEPGRWRVIAHVPSRSIEEQVVDETRLDELILERTGITFGAHDVAWTSQFDLSHGVADSFYSGRTFLAGDAAHIHSPVGGQGLNTGVQDAQNLIWRLAESRRATPEDSEELLRGYESERRGTAGPMVRGVARMTAFMTSPRTAARHLRSFLAPLLVSRPFVQAKLGRGVGMLNLSYSAPSGRRNPAQWGQGQRLPNPLIATGKRLYDKVHGTGFSWVVRDQDAQTQNGLEPDAPQWRGLPVVRLTDTDPTASSRSRMKNCVVLVRPDRYIAAVGPDPDSLSHALPQPNTANRGTTASTAAGTGQTANDAKRDSTVVT